MRKIFTLLSFILLTSPSLFAQNKRVSGRVADTDGSPVIGVSVILSGTNVATISMENGLWSLDAPADGVLEFHLIGMVSQSVAIDGRTTVDVVLAQDTATIEEVVVTALGITRNEKSLGYSVASVSSSTLEDGRESNVLNSLSGRVAGVNVMQNSGTAGGGSRIILRGQGSLSSSGQPLFVINGVPVSNGSRSDGLNGGLDSGSRIGDISGDDIESMNILKGAAATALYGARAKDGVVVITTKKGARNQPLAVSVNSSVRFDSALRLPDYQNEYAGGSAVTGKYSYSEWNGWGPKISDMMTPVEIFTGDQVRLQAYPNNVRDFFKGGSTISNSISMSGGDEKNDFRLGLSSFNQKGIVPENRYDRYNFSFNGGRRIYEGLNARVTASYIRTTSEGRPAQGSNDSNVVLPTVMRMPRTMDTQLLKDNWITADGLKPYPLGTGGIATVNNPYWVLRKNKSASELDRVMGSVFLEVKPLPGLTISNNLGLDFFNDESRRVWAKNTIGVPRGRFETVNWRESVINNDLIATYDRELGRDFDLKVIGGMNMVQSTYKTLTVDARDLLVADIYSYSNAEVSTPTNVFRRNRLVGVFGEASLSYKDLAYLTVTGRNDWSSTMPANHRSYFFPSVSGSLLFSELLPRNNVLTLGKIRASFAMVGSDTVPYALELDYVPESSYFLQYLGTGRFPHGGLSGYRTNKVFPTVGLEPQMKREFELGTDLVFLHNRLHLEATYYYGISIKNIAAFDVPNSTGYYAHRRNAGKIVNEGIEISLGGSPFKGDFSWDIDLQFASNRQIVKSLGEGMAYYSLTSGYNGLQIMAAVGEPYSIYGQKYERDPEGNYVIDSKTGERSVTATSQNLGKTAPDFTLGVSNSFSWKGVSASFLVDIRKGGVMYSQTASRMLTYGLGAETLEHRTPFVDAGVNLVTPATATSPAVYKPNETVISPYEFYTKNFDASKTEGNVYDASYVKLREVVAGYTIPQKWLGGFPVKNIFVGFEARNLWIIHSNVPHIDPEINSLATNEIGSGVEFSGVPSTRSFGFNVKFNF